MSKYTDEELDHIIEQMFEDKPKTNKDDFLQNPGPIPKNRTYSIRMDISFDRELTLEEAETAIFSGLRSAGMKVHKGGAY